MKWVQIAAIAGPGFEVIGAILLTINIFWKEERIQQIIRQERISQSPMVYYITLWISTIIIMCLMLLFVEYVLGIIPQNVPFILSLVIAGLFGLALAKWTFPKYRSSVFDNTIQAFVHKIIVALAKGNRVRQIGILGVFLLLLGFIIQSAFNILALRQIT